jgi:(1->4)-alpha-D-glucan 1-alpha-D-glucosylmutase
VNPHEGYEAAVRRFVAIALDPSPKNRFLTEFAEFLQQIVPFGFSNALSQVLLKLTSPGVPDVYQGQELWDFSLVDPDNRRPVDFLLRQQLLAELQNESLSEPSERLALARELIARPADSRLKLWVTSQTLQLRHQCDNVFRLGEYVPLQANGRCAEHVCAYGWQRAGSDRDEPLTLVVVVPRLVMTLARNFSSTQFDSRIVLPREAWEDTELALSSTTEGCYVNIFTGQRHETRSHMIRLDNLLCDFPVALLHLQH